jgi:hypothetical protein
MKITTDCRERAMLYEPSDVYTEYCSQTEHSTFDEVRERAMLYEPSDVYTEYCSQTEHSTFDEVRERAMLYEPSDVYTEYCSQTEHSTFDEVIAILKGRVVIEQYIPKKHRQLSIKFR